MKMNGSGTALVTCGAGFVGSAFCKRLVSMGFRTICVDDAPLLRPVDANVEYYNMSCQNYFASHAATEYNLIIHLGKNTTDAVDALATDAAFFKWIASGSGALGRTKVVYFSSSAVYPVHMQQRHNHNLLVESSVSFEKTIGIPDGTRGWVNLTGEYLARSYSTGEDIVCYRPFSIYGEGEGEGASPFNDILKRVLRRDTPIDVCSDSVRDFVHVDDVVDCVFHTMHCVHDGSAINIGTGRSTSFVDLANMMLRQISHAAPVQVGSGSYGYGTYHCVSNNSTLDRYGWKPKVTLEEGIRRAVAHSYDTPMLFVPRDAGFLSVFNYYIGMLTMRNRIYPIWNYDKFLKTNGIDAPKHFAYFNSASDNSWYEFFERVEFFPGDAGPTLEHPVTQGIECPSQFRSPGEFKDVIGNSMWREATHNVFKQYIRLTPALRERVDTIKREYISTDADKTTIGVHFRHPSHCCEQGIVLLRDYFREIDKIIDSHPNVWIYLATDNDLGVLAFSQRYGTRLGYIQDITRTSLDNLLEWAYERGTSHTDSMGFIGGKGYELHYTAAVNNPHGDPKLGTDVLTDVFCLAACEYFIHTASNVALAVSYINPNTKMIMIGN